MKKYFSYPYPVLGINDDFVPGLNDDSIHFNPIDETDPEFYSFEVSYAIDNPKICELIKEHKAEYVCEVTGLNTYYRNSFTSLESTIKFRIRKKDVVGYLEFSSYVAVREKIENYHNSAFNAEYGDSTFDLTPGDILVLLPTFSTHTELRFDKLYSAGAYMVIVDGGDIEMPRYEPEHDKIYISLPHDLFLSYKKIEGEKRYMESIISSIVFNGLVYAILMTQEESYSRWLWYSSMKYQIFNRADLKDFEQYFTPDGPQIGTEDAFKLAEKLLSNPYNRLIKHLEKLKEEDINESESI